MKIKSVAAIAAAIACSFAPVGAQNKSSAPPVPVKRVPAGNATSPTPDPGKYPFGQLIRTMEADSAPGVPKSPNLPPPMPEATDFVGSEAPPDYRMNRDVSLPASAQSALKVAKGWMTEKQMPAPGLDGRVLYTYGIGMPTVVCAPMRVCIVELESGEHLTGEPHVGDSVRWVISPATSGSGRLETPMLVIKPKQAGLDTTLLITTDRRAYYLRLVSNADDFLARVAFAYPPEEANRWKAHLADQGARRKEDGDKDRISPTESIDSLYFDYRISGGDVNMRPIRVVDDGRKTYVQMPAGVVARELPTLVVMGHKGAEMVNYRVKGDMYIVDRLFDRGALVLGAGKKARKAEIIRGSNAATQRPQNADSLNDRQGAEAKK